MNTPSETAPSKLKRIAFVGGTVGLSFGIVMGTASLLGMANSKPYTPSLSQCMASSVVSVAGWMSFRRLRSRDRFPALLYQSEASHANTPLEHLRLLNNAPTSISDMYPKPPFRSFVHNGCT